jgi:guanylate kinase
VSGVPVDALRELQAKAETRHEPRLIVLSGPAGGGKDTVISCLRQRKFPVTVIPTWTTRERRPNESEAVDYCFVSRTTFEAMLASGGLLEHAEYAGNMYGVPRRPVQDALARGEDVLLKIEVKGAAYVKLSLPQALLIFVTPPTIEELEWRLRQRRTEDEAGLQRRLAAARLELACIPGYDYLVINHRDRVAEAVAQVETIISAERSRVGVLPARV